MVAAPERSNPRFAEQVRVFRQARDGMAERDLILVEAVGQGGRAAALRSRFAVRDGAFVAILVGKDGDEKLRAETPILPAQLFETVDAMPMRRDEMRRRR